MNEYTVIFRRVEKRINTSITVFVEAEDMDEASDYAQMILSVSGMTFDVSDYDITVTHIAEFGVRR